MTSLVMLCSILAAEPQELDPAQANDHVAPGAVTASADVFRFEGDDSATCGDIGEINLAVSATDDATPAAQLGYVTTLASGTLPRGLTLSSDALVPDDGTVTLTFSDDGSAFTVGLSVRARDLNGNLGPPTLVEVSDPGESGCRTTRGGGGALLFPLLAAFAWLMRPARARATR